MREKGGGTNSKPSDLARLNGVGGLLIRY